jgi:hypothetical protein
MKELEKNELMEVDGGNIWLALAEAVYGVFTGEGMIGQACMYSNYYRAQMPSNWTGHGY